jgi:hypothetical protein
MTFRVHHLAALFFSASLTAAVCADDPRPSAAASERVIVLNDGQLVIGDITPRPDGYDVALPAGRMFIPSSRVRFEATSRDDAYLKMRASFVEMVPETHVSIARWCISHKLWNFARRELLDALHLDPNRDDASRLLAYVERQATRPEGGETESRSGVTVMPSTAVGSAIRAASYSLGGLSTASARSFVRDVQPLLANKCGNAACHGPRRNSFELIIPRYGSTPTIAERNLAAVMRFVTPAAPLESPVLSIGTIQHGPMRRAVFQGRTGAKQLQVLRDWVVSVSRELAPPEHVVHAGMQTTTPGTPGGAVQQAGHSEQRPARTTTPAAAVPHGRVMKRSDTDAAALQKVKLQSRKDPFDPAAFNKQRPAGPPNGGSVN